MRANILKRSFCWKQSTFLQRPGDSLNKRVTSIPGFGVGPEIIKAVHSIFEAVHVPILMENLTDFSFNQEESTNALFKNNSILLGVMSPIKGSKYAENIEFYKKLKLYAHVVQVNSIPNLKNQRHDKVDLVIIRENSEGEYTGIEHEVYPGVIESLKITTSVASQRIAEYAFEFAYLSGRKKVTAVHKANIMKKCDGLFLEECRKVASRYPFIKYEEMIVDNCSMQMVKNPKQFDVLVTPNLYGTIISNIASGITGGVGMTPGACIGEKYALFCQGTRHTGSRIAGKNIVNPSAIILSSLMLLRHLGLPTFADAISEAWVKTIKDQKVLTEDIGGTASTQRFTEEIIKNCQNYIF